LRVLARMGNLLPHVGIESNRRETMRMRFPKGVRRQVRAMESVKQHEDKKQPKMWGCHLRDENKDTMPPFLL